MYSVDSGKTTDILKSNLIQLMQHKPLCEISVQELARASHLSRSSFYYYYPSVPALAEEMEKEFIDKLNDVNMDFFSDPPDDIWYRKPNPYIKKTLELEYEFREMLIAFLGPNGTSQLRESLTKCIQHHFISKKLFYADQIERNSDTDIFFIEGHLAYIQHWLQSKDAPDFSDIAIKVYAMMFPKA